ncbi:ATP-binding protein [Dyadobacter sp.]|uniref:ATP-binding protein n=1 Tax=Dyadobacter sp. TaxID=1914288 RepID=UPI003F71DC26
MDEKYEDAIPTPEFLIKSIAEQGYSLETSISDLIDNSVSANADKIEILIDPDSYPFTLFLVDNGDGMSESVLKQCMQFPSTSPENSREKSDLGRFGLGMKTASFAQTRRFTVISKKKGAEKYCARTWDVDYLKKKGSWRILINTQEEILEYLNKYRSLSNGYFNKFEDFEANTIIVWQKLYKFEDHLDGNDRTNALKTQITEITTEYLALVFHRFMERKICPLKIRVNNKLIEPFNPFPTNQTDLRLIESRQKVFKSDIISLEGYVLPVRSIEESKEVHNIWTTKSRGLMDMEGLYIYRSDRIILFGGWNGIIRKSPRLQLARLKVEVGNKIDDLLHLNVAKSQVSIPFDLKMGFLKYIAELREQAEKEYYNRGIRRISSSKSDSVPQLFERHATNRGTQIEINNKFPLVQLISNSMDYEQQKEFRLLLKMVNNLVNKLGRANEDDNKINVSTDSDDESDLYNTIQKLLISGTSREVIRLAILPALGYRIDNIPPHINQLLN